MGKLVLITLAVIVVLLVGGGVFLAGLGYSRAVDAGRESHSRCEIFRNDGPAPQSARGPTRRFGG